MNVFYGKFCGSSC